MTLRTPPDKSYAVIVWGDAHSRSEEQKDTDIKHCPEPIQTYGWIIRSDAIGVTVAGEWLPDDKTWRDTTFVPRAMVIDEIPLRLTRVRKITQRGEQKEKGVPGVTIAQGNPEVTVTVKKEKAQ